MVRAYRRSVHGFPCFPMTSCVRLHGLAPTGAEMNGPEVLEGRPVRGSAGRVQTFLGPVRVSKSGRSERRRATVESAIRALPGRERTERAEASDGGGRWS